MKNRINRFLCLAVAVLLVLSIASCGETGTTTTPPPAEQTATPAANTAAPATQKPIESTPVPTEASEPTPAPTPTAPPSDADFATAILPDMLLGEGNACFGYDIVLDGKCDEEAWTKTQTYMIAQKLDSGGEGADGTVKALWDTDFFYLYITVNDKTADTTWNSATENNDCVEIYLNLDNQENSSQYGDNDFCIRLQRYQNNATKIDGIFGSSAPVFTQEQFEYKIVDSSDGYIIELKFPITDFAFPINEIGCDVRILDRNGSDNVTSKVGYFSTEEDYELNVVGIGYFVLVDSLGIFD